MNQTNPHLPLHQAHGVPLKGAPSLILATIGKPFFLCKFVGAPFVGLVGFGMAATLRQFMRL